MYYIAENQRNDENFSKCFESYLPASHRVSQLKRDDHSHSYITLHINSKSTVCLYLYLNVTINCLHAEMRKNEYLET